MRGDFCSLGWEFLSDGRSLFSVEMVAEILRYGRCDMYTCKFVGPR